MSDGIGEPVAYRHIGSHIHAPTGSCQLGLTTVRVAGRHARDPAPCMVIRPRRGREVGWAERISLAEACPREQRASRAALLTGARAFATSKPTRRFERRAEEVT